MEGDRRSFRVALAADAYVNPPAGELDGLEVLAGAGWGVVQLPADDYPDELAVLLLREVAEQAEEFARRGYDVVLVGDRKGLASALQEVGMTLPPQVVPRSRQELEDFLAARPTPSAAGVR